MNGLCREQMKHESIRSRGLLATRPAWWLRHQGNRGFWLDGAIDCTPARLLSDPTGR